MTVLEIRPAAKGSKGGDRPRAAGSGSELTVLGRLWRGRVDDPAWVRPLLLALLAGTALLYIVGLSSSGWANSFYSGAVQAATKSWKAFFFGSSDPGNAITVDKPPAALWVMDSSARLFGLNPWSVLVPQALEGVACVGVLYLTVRRCWSSGVALLAGLLLALTPSAAVMFRFNNPDALLVLLLVASAYAVVRAIQSGSTRSTRWLVLAGALIGLGFTTKLLQAYLVVPGLGVAYLVAGPQRLRRRIAQLAAAGVALVISSSWWLLAVELTPSSDRPYVGGSPDNNLLSVIFGYNGFGRLTGAETGSVGFRNSASAGGGNADVFRLINHDFGPYTGWLLPVALLGLMVGLYMLKSRPRQDAQRASLLLWSLWLAVTAAAFSLGQGIIHPYYSVALAPAIAALVAQSVGLLWSRRSDRRARAGLALLAVVTIMTAVFIRAEISTVHVSFLLGLSLIAVLCGAAVMAAPALRPPARALCTFLVVAACLAGTLDATISGASAAQHTPIPGLGRTPADVIASAAKGRFSWVEVSVPPTPAVARLLQQNSSAYTWVAAMTGSERAAGYQLATGGAVMPIGGFNGTDPAPTLAQFQADVARHQIHWFVAGGPGQWPGGPDAAAVTRWVETTFPETTVDGVRLYDLTVRQS